MIFVMYCTTVSDINYLIINTFLSRAFLYLLQPFAGKKGPCGLFLKMWLEFLTNGVPTKPSAGTEFLTNGVPTKPSVGTEFLTKGVPTKPSQGQKS